MATYTPIPDGNLDADSPVRDVDMLALRDNPIAIAEGASGAPRIEDAALDTTVTTLGRDWVAARAATIEHGAVGSMAMLLPVGVGDSKTYTPGTTLAGSVLRYGDARSTSDSSSTYGSAPSGTWKLMGYITYFGVGPSVYQSSLFVRVL